MKYFGKFKHPEFLLDSLGEERYSPNHLRRGPMSNEAQNLPGTLDLLILKAVSLGPLHGYGTFCASSKSRDKRC